MDCPSWSPNLLSTHREIEDRRMETITQSGLYAVLSIQQGLNSWQPSLNLQWEMTPIYAESVVRDMVLFYGISSPVMNGKDLEKTLMLGKIESKRRRGQQRMRWLDGTTDSMDMS